MMPQGLDNEYISHCREIQSENFLLVHHLLIKIDPWPILASSCEAKVSHFAHLHQIKPESFCIPQPSNKTPSQWDPFWLLRLLHYSEGWINNSHLPTPGKGWTNPSPPPPACPHTGLHSIKVSFCRPSCRAVASHKSQK